MKLWVDERLLGNFAFALRAIVEPPLSRLFYRSAHSQCRAKFSEEWRNENYKARDWMLTSRINLLHGDFSRTAQRLLDAGSRA